MHLIFLPVVHTTDKKGNHIDKFACSEFWKAKDSYRQLQDAFYKYMVENGFNLQRGLPKEETKREHYSVEEYKKITNFKQTKEILKNIKLELPDVPEIDDIKIVRWSKKRDEKILEDIIKPKDNLINKFKKIIDKFYDTIDKFIHWIVKKFDIADENKLIRDFERENHVLLDVEKQVKREDKEKELDLER